MAFTAKFVAPFPAQIGYLPPVLARALETRLTFFHAPPGFFLTSQIVTALENRKTPVIWLRLGSEDADPGVLLESLIQAARKVRAEIGKIVLEQMQRKPGPIFGWAPLFALLT